MVKLVDTKTAAELLGLKVEGLQAFRSRGGGPRFVKLGKLVRYDVADLEAYINGCKRASTADGSARASAA